MFWVEKFTTGLKKVLLCNKVGVSAGGIKSFTDPFKRGRNGEEKK